MKFSSKQKASAIRAIDLGKEALTFGREALTAIKAFVWEIVPDTDAHTETKPPEPDELTKRRATSLLRSAGFVERPK